MSRKKKVPTEVSKYMASLGAKGGLASGDAKRRGGPEYYRKAARARWGEKRKSK